MFVLVAMKEFMRVCNFANWKVSAAAPSLTLKDVAVLTVINKANVALWHSGTYLSDNIWIPIS